MTNSQVTIIGRMLISPVVLSVMLAVWAAPTSQARECSNTTLEGTYGFTAGSIILANGTPRSVIVRCQFEGRGNFTMAITQNNNANVIHPTDAGTYTVNADCTGKIFTEGSPRPIEILVVNGGNEFYSARTDPPTITTCSLRPRTSFRATAASSRNRQRRLAGDSLETTS